MVSENFEVGDPVWAKMKGYSPWPAKIVDPPSDSKAPKNKKAHFVYFFGAENFAWILDEHIRPHSESMLNTSSKKKSSSYQSAIDALINYTKIHKKEKQSPFKMKKEKVENNDKKPRAKVVKVVNSVSKKHDRKVLTNKSPVKKDYRKRSLDDINGESSAYSPSKSRKLKDYSPDHLSFIGDMPHFSSFYREEQSTKTIDRNLKHVEPSPLDFGFIGLGMMGKQIVKALIKSGHSVTVWNKTSSQCDSFMVIGAKKARSPAELILECDITFCCVSDPEASKAVIFGEQGVLRGLERAQELGLGRKGYVEMTTIDPDTSLGISEAVTMKHGIYLEAPLCGTSKDAENGTLLILAAGDKILFEQCETCFHAIGQNAYFISCDVGDGSKMSLVLSMLSGTVCAALAETVVLVERLKLQKDDFLQCIEQGPLCCENIIEKTQMMSNQTFKKVTALKHVQKDIGLSLLMGNYYSQHMPVTAAANEVYKYARLRKFSEEDMSAVYKVARF